MTELMVRLIKDGIPYAELRLQSGMALVHYFYNGDDEWEKTDIDELMCIIDSFDMGIKVGEGWKFSGDKGRDEYGDEFVLIYDIGRARWCVDYPDGDTYFSSNMFDRLFNSKRIGTIYEKEKERCQKLTKM